LLIKLPKLIIGNLLIKKPNFLRVQQGIVVFFILDFPQSRTFTYLLIHVFANFNFF